MKERKERESAACWRAPDSAKSSRIIISTEAFVLYPLCRGSRHIPKGDDSTVTSALKAVVSVEALILAPSPSRYLLDVERERLDLSLSLCGSISLFAAERSRLTTTTHTMAMI